MGKKLKHAAHNSARPYIGFLGFLLKRSSNTDGPAPKIFRDGPITVYMVACFLIIDPKMVCGLLKWEDKGFEELLSTKTEKGAKLNLLHRGYWYTCTRISELTPGS
ncbi:MAG: hypothetical protein V7724_07220 [Sediminicola sp.]